MLDNNGVPRFHRYLAFTNDGLRRGAQNFRRHPDGRYSVQLFNNRVTRNAVRLYDSQLEFIEAVGVVAPLDNTNGHEFLILPNGNYLFISYQTMVRRRCEIDDSCVPGDSSPSVSPLTLTDGVIQEVTTDGREVFRWSTWNHARKTDCIADVNQGPSSDDYAHLNSLQLVDDDVLASLRNCNQVLRIDRSSGTGAVQWQVGGSPPPGDSDTEYREIVDDIDGENEFCNQHSATITTSGSLLLFDNGTGCQGTRKNRPAFTRIVEYDISSATQAVFMRQYLLPAEHGHSYSRGSVRELNTLNWLIAWGDVTRPTIPVTERVVVSEVDPATGSAVFELNILRLAQQKEAVTYRAYRYSEADLPLPLNLP